MSEQGNVGYRSALSALKALLGAGFLVLLAGSESVTAGDTETREFRIFIDGKSKPAGEYHMKISRRADGSYEMTGQANVKVSYFVYHYHYSYKGTEVWKDNRLIELRSNSNDNGKRLAVSCAANGDRLRVEANGASRTVRGDTWLTSYWHAPPKNFRNRAIPLLDADTGKELNATLHYVGTAQINVAGRSQSCTQYRVSGDVQTNLWYDAHDRLVREDSMEDGHRTVFELVRISE